MPQARWTPITILVALAVPAAGAVVAGAQAPVFHAGANLVVLQVTVTSPDGVPPGGLQADDFTVFEDGVPRPATVFSRAREPIALSLLVDVSNSMTESLGLAQNAAIEFTHRLGPADLAEVLTFNQDVRILQPFTAYLPDLEQAIRRSRADGTTALYNALYVALREFDAVRPKPGEIRRHEIVLLSDGDDTGSLVAFDDVFDLARRSNVSVYAIRLGGPAVTDGPTPEDGAFVLRQFAHATGGRAFFVERARDLAPVYDEIAEELAGQYTLAFEPTHHDGRWHDLTVRVKPPGHAARTRAGYLASR